MRIYRGAIGLQVCLVVGDPPGTDGATLTTIKVRRPDGTATSWNASILDAETIYYTTLVGDLDMPGTYTLQAYVEYADGRKLHGEAVGLRVLDLWEW